MSEDGTPAEDLVLVLQHQEDAGPGNLGAWLTDNGVPWELVDVAGGDLPLPRRYRGMVVLGSRDAAYDESLPWLAAEREFVRAAIDAGTPVFGICFGAQLMAQLFGGDAHKADTTERGWVKVTPSVEEDAREYADLIDGTWFEWHGDEVTVPPTATVLAEGSCVQAFSQGPHLAVQFHPEVTTEQLTSWMESDRRLKLLAEAGGERGELLADTAAHLPDAVAAAGRLYARFFSAS